MARQKKIFPLRQLKLFGFDYLDPVMIAALADERPLLLIGPHGTAKSEMLNRLAAALGLEHRHYNASLLNFDDLMGYPIPDREQGRLDFLQTPASIWGAESVFLDEISRCRPEAANKLFSIIHESRIQGIELPGLRYRWSAMNPPPHEDLPADDAELYLGSMPLDPALADRFAWVLPIPAIDELSARARRQIIAHGGDTPSAGLDIDGLLRSTRRNFMKTPAAEKSWVVGWVDALIDALREMQLPISGRRALILRDSPLWIRAAARVLGRGMSLDAAAFLALQHGLPQRAEGRTIDTDALSAAHRMASQLAGEPPDGIWRSIRAARDPARRIALGLQAPEEVVDNAKLSGLISDTISGLPIDRRWALSLLLLRHPSVARVDAPTLEILARPLERVISFSVEEEHRIRARRSRAGIWNDILTEISKLQKERDPDAVELGNLYYTLFAVEEEDFDAPKLSASFRKWRGLLEPAPLREVS